MQVNYTEVASQEAAHTVGKGSSVSLSSPSADSLMQVVQEHPKADTFSTEDKKDKHMDDLESGKNGDVAEDRLMQVDSAITTPKERVESDFEIQNREVSAHRSPAGVINTTTTKPEVIRYQIPQRRPLFTSPRRKLLILDVNGLLADIVNPPPLDRLSNTNISGRAIFKRPFYYDFLNFCFERFDVGIWSSRSKWIIDRVVDYLLGNLKHKLLFCWDMFHCTRTSFGTLENRHKPLVLKELRKLWEKHDPNLPWEKGDYNESNTLLVDDSPYKALLNPMHTGVFPYSYLYTNASDNSLGPGGDLRVYLEGLATAENVQNYVAQCPFGQGDIIETHLQWSFYSQVLQGFGLQSDREQTH